MQILALLCIAWFGGPDLGQEQVSISFEIPRLKVNPYHKPYVAVWVETEDRTGLETVVVWYEGKDWLKDLRQWWRKLGRDYPEGIDGVTGATQKPGPYTITWNGLDAQGKPVPNGTYYINIEAARENGGRDFHRQKVVLGGKEPQNYTYAGNVELRDVVITVKSGG